jgi:hypothetical protein
MRYMPKMMAASSTTIAPIGVDLVDDGDVDGLPTLGCPPIFCAAAALNWAPVQVVGLVVAQNGITLPWTSVILEGKYVSDSNPEQFKEYADQLHSARRQYSVPALK